MQAAFPSISSSASRSSCGMRPLWGLAMAILLCAALFFPASALAETPPPTILNYCYQGKVSETRLVVVNKSLQRIMVFRYMGKLMLEYEFPVATGTNPGAKSKSGDERTPVGIYFTTHRYQDRKITIFGDRAIHLNYPNPVDQVEGKQGNGIYIHGTNQDLRKRSSNGCVTMRNQDLALIEPMIIEQLTPVVVVESLELAPLAQRDQACDQLRKLEGALSKGPAKFQPALALAGNGHNHKKLLTSLAGKLAAWDQAKKPPAKAQNNGLILLGLGQQWVLVADQVLKGPKRRSISVTRRFYLTGPEAQAAQLLRGDWVVPDLASAKTLASWAPAAKAPKPVKPVKPPAPEVAKTSPEDQLQRTIKQWMAAWQSKKLKRYMSYYAPNFRGDGKNRRQWYKRKAYLNKVYKKIRVRAEKMQITVKGNQAQVSFIQHYRSDWHKDVGKKTMVWELNKGRWRIVKEDWNRLPGRASGSESNGRQSS